MSAYPNKVQLLAVAAFCGAVVTACVAPMPEAPAEGGEQMMPAPPAGGAVPAVEGAMPVPAAPAEGGAVPAVPVEGDAAQAVPGEGQATPAAGDDDGDGAPPAAGDDDDGSAPPAAGDDDGDAVRENPAG